MPAEMEFIARKSGQGLVLLMKGRLDAASSELLDKEIEELVRAGERHVHLDMGEVTYMSSAGIRSIIKNYKQFGKFGGSFGICNPSEIVRKLLKLTSLEMLLRETMPAAEAPRPATVPGDGWKLLDAGIPELSCEIRSLPSKSPFKCMAYGDPEKLMKTDFREGDMRSESFGDDEFSIGLGAFGSGYQDCISRFGEFIAVSGAAACLPANDIKFPDFVSKKDKLPPEIKVLYSIGFKGEPSFCMRFESMEGKRHAALSEIMGAALAASKTATIGVVMLAESSGLLGASLKKSPAETQSGTDFFSHPDICQRLDFSADRVFDRSMSLVCGVVSLGDGGALSPLLRPMGAFSGKKICGHLHAAAFSYHAIQKDAPDLGNVVNGLFEESRLLGVLHLICDDRDISGAGESLFSGGMIWFGELKQSENTVAP